MRGPADAIMATTAMAGPRRARNAADRRRREGERMDHSLHRRRPRRVPRRAGRWETGVLPPVAMLERTMTLISDLHADAPSRVDHPRPSAPAWTSRALVEASGSVAALRHRPCFVPGELGSRTPADGSRLVSATDLDGAVWWITAAAVWSDAAVSPEPQRPLAVGLASADSAERAFLAGLSDRLGWEAVMAFERGDDLPTIAVPDDVDAGNIVLLDGRLGHDVPTALLLGDDIVRWGAGSTWAAAVRRALFGHAHGRDHGSELGLMAGQLRASGLQPVVVDLGSPILARAGIVRTSVQLLPAN